MNRKNPIILALAVLLVGTMGAYAVAPAGVTWIDDTSYEDAAAGASSSDTTEGGNITKLNITSINSSTERWAGYLGNVSNSTLNVVLANQGGDVFYDWTWSIANDGEVCAGIATSYTWDDLVAGTAANLDTAWGFGAVDDNAVNTFTDTQTVTIGGSTIAAGPSANTGPNVADTFETSLLVDSAGSTTDTDFLFCSIMQKSSGGGTAYNGQTVDYEVIVPVTFGAKETYYFFVELG